MRAEAERCGGSTRGTSAHARLAIHFCFGPQSILVSRCSVPAVGPMTAHGLHFDGHFLTSATLWVDRCFPQNARMEAEWNNGIMEWWNGGMVEWWEYDRGLRGVSPVFHPSSRQHSGLSSSYKSSTRQI